jgi:hypothetical protein
MNGSTLRTAPSPAVLDRPRSSWTVLDPPGPSSTVLDRLLTVPWGDGAGDGDANHVVDDCDATPSTRGIHTGQGSAWK